jgi:hypothetical protein
VTTGPACPPKLRGPLQQLAGRAHVPVLCPTWLPAPLARLVPPRTQLVEEARRGRWLVGFDHVDPGFSGLQHVVLEGYQGAAWPPTCPQTERRQGKIVNVSRACFAGRRGAEQVAGRRVTWYVHNRAVETGHVAAVFSTGGATYVVGVHVYPPLTQRSARTQARRIVRGLALVQP